MAADGMADGMADGWGTGMSETSWIQSTIAP